MKNSKSRFLACAAALGFTAMSGAAHGDAMTTPAMAGPLAANTNPFSVEFPDWLGPAAGKVYVTGAVSGLAYWQSSPFDTVPGDDASLLDISNAQVFVQKTDGWLQFFIQVGDYSLPALGTPYLKSSAAVPAFYGVVPQAFLKLQGQGDWSSFSIEGGKLPTLIGAEYTFTFENMNIERGLLWNQENAVNQGVQLNYTNGPLTASVTWNDGFYSGRLNWLWGLISYGFNNGADTISLVGGGNLGTTPYSTSANTVPLNNSDIVNVIYTHTSGPWTITPYFQWTDVPRNTKAGFLSSASTVGGALLVSYSLDDNWKIAARGEYISDSGKGATAPNLLYGKGSNAWSVTLTPSYQWKLLFARADFSYVGAGSITPGSAFGLSGSNKSQVRTMLEAGVLF